MRIRHVRESAPSLASPWNRTHVRQRTWRRFGPKLFATELSRAPLQTPTDVTLFKVPHRTKPLFSQTRHRRYHFTQSGFILLAELLSGSTRSYKEVLLSFLPLPSNSAGDPQVLGLVCVCVFLPLSLLDVCAYCVSVCVCVCFSLSLSLTCVRIVSVCVCWVSVLCD